MQDSADGLVMVKGDGITEMFVYRAVLVSVIKYKNMRLNREAHTVLIKKGKDTYKYGLVLSGSWN